MHPNTSANFTSKPTPITKGRKKIPFFCRAADTSQGTPPHSSIPSVIKIIMFRQLLQGVKSAALSPNE
jgi:hypothetical protein